MKITVDTNILVRAATMDDPVQGSLAQDLLRSAETVAVALPALCEFCWVLRRAYKFEPAEIADSLRSLLGGAQVVADVSAVEAGLAMLEHGGDFADGVIAHDGKWLGADIFMSFDKEAVRLLSAQGHDARIPA